MLSPKKAQSTLDELMMLRNQLRIEFRRLEEQGRADLAHARKPLDAVEETLRLVRVGSAATPPAARGSGEG